MSPSERSAKEQKAREERITEAKKRTDAANQRIDNRK
jgi:hypothetical protein